MWKHRLGVIGAVLAFGGVTAGCDSDDPVPNPGQTGGMVQGTGGMAQGTGGMAQGTGGMAQGTGGMAQGTGGTGGGGELTDDTPLRPGCPSVLKEIPPVDGVGAEKGECCYRGVGNSKRIAAAPDGLIDLEYRLNYDWPLNHPVSLSLPDVFQLSLNRADEQRRSLLFRMTVPVAGGQLQAGAGSMTVGTGTYNCNGTYSFYEGAAPVKMLFPGAEDPGRWNPEVLEPVMYDPASTGATFFTYDDEVRPRNASISPFVEAMEGGGLFLDWELITRDLELLEFNPSNVDCLGSYDEVMQEWSPAGRHIAYAPLTDNYQPNNAENGITSLDGIQFSQFAAFGPLVAGNPLDPVMEPRCMPGTEGCAWFKLPDSLCPEADTDPFRCHVGWDNPSDMYAPDPSCSETDAAASDTSEGQCCDPLGQSETLPACNAYVIISEFVAVSAEITDEPVGTMFQGCP